MLRKKETYTVVTPIPGFIPRQLALDILHSHSEVITLNPLVLSHRPVPAPRTAAADEYYSTWYEIVERIQYLPGLGSTITFTGCFHDMPWGLQTHVYAPLHVDLRNRYRVAGNQPGLEPPDPRPEMGLDALGAPRDGLYLREDIEIKCNIALVSFVKAQLRAASREMIRRFIKKAELLDAGLLRAMMDDAGRLRTVNPNDRSRPLPDNAYVYSPLLSPSPVASPDPYRLHHRQSHHHHQQPSGLLSPKTPPPADPPPVELPADPPGSAAPPPPPESPAMLAGRPVSGALSPPRLRDSTSSSSDHHRWSDGQLSPSLPDTRRTSVSSAPSLVGARLSPRFSRHGFTAELPAPDESKEAPPQPDRRAPP